MSEPRDPFDVLRDLRQDSAVTPGQVDAAAASVLARIRRGEAPVMRRRPRRRWLIAGSVGVLLGTGGVATALLWNDGRPTEIFTLACWNTAPEPTELHVVEWTGADPVDTCLAEWREGRFATVPAGDPPMPLTACVTDLDAVAVVPGPVDICGQLGFVPFDAVSDPKADALRKVLAEINDELSQRACLSEADGAAAAQRKLDAAGIEDWTVVRLPSSFTDAEPCATAGADPATRSIYIVPIAPA